MKWLLCVLCLLLLHISIGKDDLWHITLQNKTKIDGGKYDCKELITVCAEKQCKYFAGTLNHLPTESMFINGKLNEQDGSPNLKIGISGWKHKHDTLLCVNDNFFRVVTPMSGIIQAGGTLDMVEIVPHETSSTLVWTVNKLTQSNSDERQRPCDVALKACKNNLKSCLMPKQAAGNGFPFLSIDELDTKLDAFHKLSQCDDKGLIKGHECQNVVCASRNDKPNEPVHVPGIVKCGLSYHAATIHYHANGDKWCLSKYEKGESPSLVSSLSSQGTDEEQIKIIMNQMHPVVKSIHFYDDAVERIKNVDIDAKDLTKFEEDGLLKFHANAKPFKELKGPEKDIFAALRKCKFVDSSEKSCMNKIVLPWDILQIMINKGYIKVGNEENEMDENAEQSKHPPPEQVDKKLKEAERKHAGETMEKEKKVDMEADDVIQRKQKPKKGILDRLLQNSGNVNVHLQSVTLIMSTVFTIVIGVGAFFIYIN